MEDKLTLQTDPVQWVNQDSQTIKDIRKVEKLAGGSSELGVYATADDVFTDKFATFAHDFTRKTLDESPEEAADRFEHRDRDRQHRQRRARRQRHRAAWRGRQERVRRRADRREGVDGRATTATRSTSSSAPVPARSRRARPVVRSIRDEHPPAGRDPGDAQSGLAVVGVGLLDNLEANRIELTYLAMLFVFLFLAIRLRSIIRSLLSLVPVLIAVGISSLVVLGVQHRAEPDDRGRRAAGDRGVYRVHVADPVALRRGTSSRVRTA